MIPLLFQATELTKTDTDVNAQTVFSYTVPAGLLAPGTSLLGRGEWSANAVVAVSKSLVLSFGGVGAGTYQMSTTQMDYRLDFQITAVNDANFKAWWPSSQPLFGGAVGAQYAAGARNLSGAANTLSAAMNWGTAGSGTNTLTFRPFKLWLVP